jgi:ParB family chromosome partitioning protein
MAKRNALGKGLGALIESEEPSSETVAFEYKAGTVAEIDIDLIDTNPYQTRTIFDEETLEELATSIREVGIIQPLTVRMSDDGKFQLISGERRLKASKMAGITKVPTYIRDANDENMLEFALIENIQREDLDAIEVAISYQRLIDECELTQEELSQRVGKKRATVTNYLRLLRLPAEIQLGIKNKKLSMGHARTIINVEDPKDQINIFHEIISKDLSVRKVEDLVRNLNKKANKQELKKDNVQPSLTEYNELKSHLSDFFNTNIEFKRNNNGSGRIVIPFKSDDELEQLIAIFDRLNA